MYSKYQEEPGVEEHSQVKKKLFIWRAFSITLVVLIFIIMIGYLFYNFYPGRYSNQRPPYETYETF
jgi:uncharacterized membrane protein